MKHYVLYSHGFGVRKDDRGLMTDIAASLPGFEHILFDYNQFNHSNSELIVAPIDEQVAKLNEVIESLPLDSNSTLDIIAHSQGCVVAALAQPTVARRILFITPPEQFNKQTLINIFGSRAGSQINLKGESRMPRTDGTTTIIPSSYWKSIESVDPVAAYSNIAMHSQVTICNASNDEVLDSNDFRGLSTGIEVITIKGNHDFSGEYRKNLLTTIAARLG